MGVSWLSQLGDNAGADANPAPVAKLPLTAKGGAPSKKGGFAFFLLLACFRHLLISTSRPRFLSSPTSLACHTLVTSQIQHSTNT